MPLSIRARTAAIALRCVASYPHRSKNATQSASTPVLPSSSSASKAAVLRRSRRAGRRVGVNWRSINASTTATERSLVNVDADAMSESPLRACATAMAVDIATFMVIKRTFTSACFSNGSRSAGDSAFEKRGAYTGSVSRSTNQPRAPLVVARRASRSSAVFEGKGVPFRSWRRKASSKVSPTSCASSNVTSDFTPPAAAIAARRDAQRDGARHRARAAKRKRQRASIWPPELWSSCSIELPSR
mmetsp:Transcript_5447/g.19295  ORF Transcript_5447/g.19295 Transcript_5447/m.19295 type:complete len:244 (-) Transcript_5447:21-752(-)